MSKKKAKTQGPQSSQFQSDVIKTIGMTAGKGLINRLWPSSPVIQRAQSVLRINCPIHGETSPSMDIDFVRGAIHCYGCAYHTRSIFRFLQDAKGWLFREALDQLRQHTSVKIFSDTTTKELDAYDVHQTATKVIGDVFNTHLQNLLSPSPESVLPEYTEVVKAASKATLDWLFTERKRDPDYVARLPYGVVPPRHIFDKLVVAWFERDMARRHQTEQPFMDKTFKDAVLSRINELWSSPMGVSSEYVHAVSLHTGYSLSQPGRIRLRRPNVEKSDGLRVLPGYEEGAANGYFGLYLPTLVGRQVSDDKKEDFDYYVVEGEMDTLAAMEGVLRHDRAGVLFIASCGTASDTDALAEAGIVRVRLVGDEPSETFGKGDKWTLDRLSSAVEVDAMVFSRWEVFQQEAPTAKDPDEVIQALGFSRFYDVVVKGGRANYRTATEWALDRIQDDIATRHIERDNVRAVTEIAGRYGQCVRHPASQAGYIDRVAEMFNIPPGPLRQEIVQARDTEESFRLRITERMRYEYHPMYFEAGARGHIMTLHHKQTRKLVTFPMTDGETIANALASVHGNVYEYVRTHIGLPAFLSGTDKEGMPLLTPEKSLIKDLYFYMKLAAQDLIKGLPERRMCVEYGQGTYLLEDPNHPGELALYINNGQRVYKGNFPSATSTTVQWVELEGPGDGRYIFRPAQNPWSAEITSVQDLLQGNSISLADIREAVFTVERLIGNNWSFVYQNTDPTFLAFHLFASAVNCAFKTKVIVSFIGDYHSGKSKLLSIFSGVTDPALQLLECTSVAANFSPAAIYQGHDRSSMNLAMDEFEDEGEKNNTQKARAVADISEMLRTVIGEAGARIVRGTNSADGQGKEYLVHTNVFIASILRAQKAQDESRRFDIEMKKDPEKKSPAQAIFSQITAEEWFNIRRIITLGMPKLVLGLRRAYELVRDTVSTTKIVPFNVPDRYLTGMYHAAALMQLLGYDWKAFIVRVCEARRMKLQTVAAETASAVLYDRFFRTPGIKLGEVSKAQATLLELLADDRDADLINASRSGVFYMKDKRIAVINWITVQSKGGILDYWPDYRSMDHRNLKHTFDQNMSALRSEEYERNGIKQFIQGVGDQYRPDLISVVRLDDVIEEIRKYKIQPEEAGPNVVPMKRPGGGGTPPPIQGNNNNIS